MDSLVDMSIKVYFYPPKFDEDLFCPSGREGFVNS